MPESTAFDSLIRGDLVLPGGVLRDGYLALAGERIAAIGAGAAAPVKGEAHDFSGRFVLAGAVDGHVHCGSDVGWDGLEGMTRAALTGGTTTAVDMPYDVPETVHSADLFRRKVEKVRALAHMDIALYGTIRKEGGLDAIPELAEAGCAAFKVSTYENSPTRFPRIAHADMRTAFRLIAETGLAVSVHNEDQELVDALIRRFRAEGKTGPEWHEPSRPPLSEWLANAEVFEIAAEAGARVHIAHSATARGFDQAAAYRAQGVRATAETCVQYLVFSNEDMVRIGAKAKVNPPIRPEPERERLWERLKAGLIAFVSTDHAPWRSEKKRAPAIFDNLSGARGIETLMLAFYSEGVAGRGLPIEAMSYYLSEAPARHFGLYPRKGALKVGSDADIVVLDPTPFVFDEAAIPDTVRSSLYHGRRFAGRIAATFVRGRKAFDGERVLVEKGFGRFVRPVSAAA
ncbi:MAG: amidohydrolase family protein [Proteobacteria bacterium]|nr:amidohydrolase family protein [Pseudomonadota bacterium]